ncbi:hypothetical protein RvY_05375-2 [Ramazzottius varieornatus]|nr:hypothetical protein RvY_05375-2 [Ramazzottius varieornatus]
MNKIHKIRSELWRWSNFSFRFCFWFLVMAFSEPRLMLGELAPDFTATALVDFQFEDLTLSTYRGKYVVLFFYPADFTFVCPTELVAFSDRIAEFKVMDCEVIGVSTDTHWVHLAWVQTPRKMGGLGEIRYPLVADRNTEIGKKYGVYCQGDGNCFRGLFIIDRRGILRQITINDMGVGRSIDEVLRLVQALQYTDVHGVVCPANWKPGNETMHADPAKAIAEYFSKQA